MVRSVGTTGVGMDLEDEGDEAVIDVGAHVTNIVVHAGGTTRFVRILPSGGRDITLAIARGLGVEDDVAERLKRGERSSRRRMPRTNPRSPAERSAQSRCSGPRASWTRSVPRWSSIRRSRRAPGSARVVITGGGSKLDGFLDLLRERIPVQVESGPGVPTGAVRSCRCRAEALTEAEPLLAVADRPRDPREGFVSQVNLLPPDILERRSGAA